jgi:hypothetical protein
MVEVTRILDRCHEANFAVFAAAIQLASGKAVAMKKFPWWLLRLAAPFSLWIPQLVRNALPVAERSSSGREQVGRHLVDVGSAYAIANDSVAIPFGYARLRSDTRVSGRLAWDQP